MVSIDEAYEVVREEVSEDFGTDTPREYIESDVRSILSENGIEPFDSIVGAVVDRFVGKHD